jgi:MraZ protein
MTISENTFIGEYTFSIDSKGRINIPSKFRQSLSIENDSTFVISRGLDLCIYAYPLTTWQGIEQNLKSLSSLSKTNRSFIRNTVRHATPTKYDKQGRIPLSQSLIDFANLEKEVLIIGVVNKLEIWNPEQLDIIEDNNSEVDQHSYDNLAEKIIL